MPNLQPSTGRAPLNARHEPSMDAVKLLTLAHWFDEYDDARKYEGKREVQDDLRRIAAYLASAPDPVAVEAAIDELSLASFHCGKTNCAPEEHHRDQAARAALLSLIRGTNND